MGGTGKAANTAHNRQCKAQTKCLWRTQAYDKPQIAAESGGTPVDDDAILARLGRADAKAGQQLPTWTTVTRGPQPTALGRGWWGGGGLKGSAEL